MGPRKMSNCTMIIYKYNYSLQLIILYSQSKERTMRYTQGALLQPGAGIGGFLRTAGTFLKRFILPAAKKAITSKAGKQSMKAIAKGAKEVLTNVVSGDTGENKQIVHKVKK